MSLRRFVLVGHPVAHSVSPAMHAAAYRELGVDARYETLDVPDEAALRRVVEALRSGDLAGANVTVPWKRVACALADDVDESALATRAANVLATVGGRVVAFNTDVAALADELCAAEFEGEALVLGAGGAGLAAVAACSAAGALRIAVATRSLAPGAASEASRALTSLGAVIARWPEPGDVVDVDTANLRLVVQATSAGMLGGAPGEDVARVVPWARLDRATLGMDLVYNPPLTPFLQAAVARGLRTVGGVGMLVGQAARAIEIWLGASPSVLTLRGAAEAALAPATEAGNP